MDDPTLFVISKMQEVLEELHVTVETFYLYDQKSNIPTLPQTLKNADGMALVDICSSFWMPAGCMAIKTRSARFICVPL